jgi:hypothetical protein
MTAESSLAAAFRLAVLNMIETVAQVSNLRTQLLITLHLSLITGAVGRWQTRRARDYGSDWFPGRERL